MSDRQSILDSLLYPAQGKENRSASPASHDRHTNSSRPTSAMSISTGLATPTAGRQHKLKQRFTVIRKLGKGTYGKVQLAINKETGQEVAIKTIKKTKIENEQDLQRVRREIQIMSSIEHPHIIHIYEVFENKDKIVLVMQYAPGGELYEYVSQAKLLDDNEARRLFRQIATAIYYCHENKICHRDLKLENILLDEKNNAKLADFGLSNVFDKRRQLRTFCGSPLYASPEIVQGSPYHGPEVDCWSLGVLLYTLVYGAMPFDGSNFKRLVKQISEASYFEPKQRSLASPLIKRLLCAEPSKRATILDICSDAWVNGVSVPMSPNKSPDEQASDLAAQQQRVSHQNLLKVAKDMADLTPVRLDILMALAPSSPVIQEPTREPLAPLRAEPDNSIEPDPPKKSSPAIVFDSSAMQIDENRATSPVASYVVRDLDDDQMAISELEQQNDKVECDSDPLQSHDEAHMDTKEDQFTNPTDTLLVEEESMREVEELDEDLTKSQPGESLSDNREYPACTPDPIQVEIAHLESSVNIDHSMSLDLQESQKLRSEEAESEPVKVDVNEDRTEPMLQDLNIEQTRMEVDLTAQPDSKSEEKLKDHEEKSDPVADLQTECNQPQVEEKPKKVKKKVIVVRKRKKVVKKEKEDEGDKGSPEIGKDSRRSSLSQGDSKTSSKQKPGKIRIPDTFQSSDSESAKPTTDTTKTQTEARRPSALVIDVSQRLLQQGAAASSPPISSSNAPQLPNARVSDKKDEFERRASLAAQQPERLSKTSGQDSGPTTGDPSFAPVEDGRWSHESKTPTADRSGSLVDQTSDKFDPSEMERKLVECLQKLESVVAEHETKSLGATLDATRDDRSDSVETLKADLSPAPLESPEPTKTIRSSISINLRQDLSDQRAEPMDHLNVESKGQDSSRSSVCSDKSLTGPAPITRSYKKVTFTKEGACITETGKVYSAKGEDGTVRRIERKSKVTHYPASSEQTSGGSKQTEQREEEEVVVTEDLGGHKNWQSNSEFQSISSRTSSKPFGKLIMPGSGAFEPDELSAERFLTRNRSPHMYQNHPPLGRQDSNSSCSSGSTDIFDDIFDRWTGAISMFRRSSRPKFAFPTLDDEPFEAKSLFDRRRHNRSREGSAEPGFGGFFPGGPRCGSAEPTGASDDLFKTGRAHRTHKNSRRGWRSRYDESASSRDPRASQSGYESDVATPSVWPRRANSSLGQQPDSSSQRVERSDHMDSLFGRQTIFGKDVFSELRQEHEHFRQTIANQHKQFWKGSTPSLFDNTSDAFGKLPPIGLAAHRQRAGLGLLLRNAVDPTDSRPRSSSGWASADAESTSSPLRASVPLNSAPKRTGDTAVYADHLPPQPIRHSQSKTSSIVDQLANVQLGGVRSSGSADCQTASFIELKRTSSSADKQQFLCESKTLMSSLSGAESSTGNLCNMSGQAPLLSQSSGQSSCIEQLGDVDSRIQNWLQDSATNLSASSGSLRSFSTNLSSSRLVGGNRKLELSEEQRASLLPPVGVQMSSSRTSSSQLCIENQIQMSAKQGHLVQEHHGQQVCQEERQELAAERAISRMSRNETAQVTKTSSSARVSKSSFSKSTSVRITSTESSAHLEPNPICAELTGQSNLRSSPSTAPIKLDPDSQAWPQSATSVWRASDDLNELGALEQTDSASSSLLEQLRSRGYRSMINQRLVSQATSGIDPGSSATLSSCNIIEGSTRSVELSTNESRDKMMVCSSQKVANVHQQVITTSSSSTSTSGSVPAAAANPESRKLKANTDQPATDDEQSVGPIEQNQSKIDPAEQVPVEVLIQPDGSELAARADEHQGEEDDDIRAARENIKLHLDRMRETENFLKSIRAEEESLERRRQQMSLFNDLIMGPQTASQFKVSTIRSAPISGFLSTDTNGFLTSIPRTSVQSDRADKSDFRSQFSSSHLDSAMMLKTSSDLAIPEVSALAFRPPPLTNEESWRSMRSRSQLGDQFGHCRPSRRPLSANLDSITLLDSCRPDLAKHNVYFPSRNRRSSSLLRRPSNQFSAHAQLHDLADSASYRNSDLSRSQASSDDIEMKPSHFSKLRSSNLACNSLEDEDEDEDCMNAYRVSSYVPKVVPQGVQSRGRTLRRPWNQSELSTSSVAIDKKRQSLSQDVDKESTVSPVRRTRAMSSVRDDGGAHQVSSRRLSLSALSTSDGTENSRLTELEKRIVANRQRREELLANSGSKRSTSLVQHQTSNGEHKENEISSRQRMRELSPATSSPDRKVSSSILARPSRLESMEARIKMRSYCVRMSSLERARKSAYDPPNSACTRAKLDRKSFDRAQDEPSMGELN